MRNLVIIFSFVCICSMASANGWLTFNEYDSTGVFVKVDKMPEFSGGDKALLDFIGNNFKYPQCLYFEEIRPIIYVQFIIDTIGNIINPKILKGYGGEIDEEVIKLISSMPKWIPGELSGKKVKVLFTIPIRLELK